MHRKHDTRCSGEWSRGYMFVSHCHCQQLTIFTSARLSLLSWNTWGAPPWSSGSVLDHRSLRRVFESWRGHIWRLFHIWLRLITFGGRSAHLAYHVHKSGRKTPIIIILEYMIRRQIFSLKYLHTAYSCGNRENLWIPFPVIKVSTDGY